MSEDATKDMKRRKRVNYYEISYGEYFHLVLKDISLMLGA